MLFSLVLTFSNLAIAESVCTPLNNDTTNGDRCGPSIGRCNKKLKDDSIYCNSGNGWCGDSDTHKNAQPNEDIYDYEPQSCTTNDIASLYPISYSTISNISCGDSISGAIQANETHIFALTLPTANGNGYSLLLDSCDSAYDTFLYFYDANFSIISACDDCGSCAASTRAHLIIPQGVVNSGTYLLGIGGYASSFGVYNLSLSCTQCYEKYDCDEGYMDKTEGNGYEWACGSACPGKVSYTDVHCNCACVPQCPGTFSPTFSPTLSPIMSPSSAPTNTPISPTNTPHTPYSLKHSWIPSTTVPTQANREYTTWEKEYCDAWHPPIAYYKDTLYILEVERNWRTPETAYEMYKLSETASNWRNKFFYDIKQLQLDYTYNHDTKTADLNVSRHFAPRNDVLNTYGGDLRLSSQQWTQQQNKWYIVQNNYPCSWMCPTQNFYYDRFVSNDPDSISCDPYQGIYANSSMIVSLVSIDLSTNFTGNNGVIIHRYIPYIKSANRVCIAANQSHLFIVSHKIWIYDIATAEARMGDAYNGHLTVDYSLFHDTKHRLINNSDFLMGVSCALSNDYKYLYMFGGDVNDSFAYPSDNYIGHNKIFKYDIFADQLHDISPTNGEWEPKQWTRALTAPNGLIFLYGSIANLDLKCVDETWLTSEFPVRDANIYSIFNVETDEFLNDTHSRQTYTFSFAAAAVYNEEVLVRLSKNGVIDKFDLSLEVLPIVDLFVDFSALSDIIILGSDTFVSIDSESYEIRDYFLETKQWNFLFYSTNLISTQIKFVMKLIGTDYCVICYNNSKDEYCHDCINGFPIPSLHSKDNNISVIIFEFELINKSCVDCIVKPESKQVRMEWNTQCVIDLSQMMNANVIPGQTIPIVERYSVINCQNTNPKDEIARIHFQSIELAIDMNVEINVTSQLCHLICDSRNTCTDCLDGLWPSIATKDVKPQYGMIVTLLSSAARILPLNLVMKLSGCGYGSGVSMASSLLTCDTCQINQFKMETTIAECFTCDVDLDGVTCLGVYSVNIQFNYWVSGVNKDNEFIDLTKVTNEDVLFSQLCAPGMCCTDNDGCDYLNDTTFNISNRLCARGRHHESVLCSQCITGQYELFGSSSCGVCDDFAAGYMLIIIFLSMIFTLYIFFMDATNVNIKPYSQNEINWKRVFIKDENTALKIMVFRIIVYYFQSMSQILSSVGTPHDLVSIVQVFGDFSIDVNLSNSANGVCVLPKLDPLSEIIWASIFIYFVLFHSIWICIVITVQRIRKPKTMKQKLTFFDKGDRPNNTNKVRHDTKKIISVLPKVDTSYKDTVNIKWHEMIDFFGNKQASMLMALIRIFTISSGSILTMSFKLMTCVSIQSKQYHLYDANHHCFDGYFFFGLTCVLLIIGIYLCIFYKIYKIEANDRYNPTKNKYYKFISPFHPHLWYWECCIFSRRLIISLLTSNILLNHNLMFYFLTFTIVIYLTFHAFKKPYGHARLNVMEAICLVSLIMISILIKTQNVAFNNILITISILFPIIIFLIYVIKIIFFICKSYKNPTEFTESDVKRIKKIQKRNEELFNINLDKISISNKQLQTENNHYNGEDNIEEKEIVTETNHRTLKELNSNVELTEMQRENAKTMNEIDNETVKKLQKTETEPESNSEFDNSYVSESEVDEPSVNTLPN